MSKKDDERQRKAREEYIELLKMKQGIIEESELIPETGYEKIRELHGFEKVTNYCYHNKWFILIGAFLAAIVIFLVVQAVSREKEDLFVCVVAMDHKSELGWRLDDLEEALEMYCPDFDGNGNVHVLINYIDLSSENQNTEYHMAQQQKYTASMMSGDGQLILTDTGLWESIYEKEQFEDRIFIDYSDKYPEELLYKSCGVRVRGTDLRKDARWDTCPENVVLFVREELDTGMGSMKEKAKQRERAEIVLKNIVEGNIINPKTED